MRKIEAQVHSYPTIADLHIALQRASKTMKLKWNLFNTISLATRRGNLKAELIQETSVSSPGYPNPDDANSETLTTLPHTAPRGYNDAIRANVARPFDHIHHGY